MPFLADLTERLKFLKTVSPSNLRRLMGARLSDVVLRESTRSRTRLELLTQRYPSAGPRELAQRLIDQKKSYASMVGGISGVFGVISVPADLLIMVYLQMQLLTEIATLYKVNLKADHSRTELLDVFGYANGIGPMQRASPKLLGKVAQLLLKKGGLETVGKAMPLVAAPVSAYLNNQHIQQVGEDALRHYDGFAAAHQKSRKASGT